MQLPRGLQRIGLSATAILALAGSGDGTDKLPVGKGIAGAVQASIETVGAHAAQRCSGRLWGNCNVAVSRCVIEARI